MLTKYPEAAECFKPYVVTPEGKETELYVSREEWNYLGKKGIKPSGQNEASILTSIASDWLLEHNRCIMHGVALRYSNQAWIITGDSGVGKTTQARILKELDPDSFDVICGDRPVLEMVNNEVIVHPSPWNGKENWKGAPASPLSGIICLHRGENNIVRTMTKQEAVLPVFRAIIQTGCTEHCIQLAATFTGILLERCYVWEQVSAIIPESGKMLYERVFQEVGK